MPSKLNWLSVMTKINFDLSLIMTFHHEGRLAYRSLRNAFHCIQVAYDQNINVELIGVMDKINNNTREIVENLSHNFNALYDVDFGDLGPSRNFAVNNANGTYIAYLDADDFFGEDWLVKAYKTARQHVQEKKYYLYHPHYMFCFNDRNSHDYSLRRMYDYKNIQYSDIYLLEHCLWPSLCFGLKEIFLNTPYRQSTAGFGYEDWDFNCDVLSNGYPHYVVANTAHFVRLKTSNSLSIEKRSLNKSLSPSKLFSLEYIDNHIKPGLLKKNIRVINSNTDSVSIVDSQDDQFVFYQCSLMDKIIGHLYTWLKQHNQFLFILINAFVTNFFDLSIDGHGIQNQATIYVPRWLINECSKIHLFEPMIYNDFNQMIKNNYIPKPFIARSYLKLLPRLKGVQNLYFLTAKKLELVKDNLGFFSKLESTSTAIVLVDGQLDLNLSNLIYFSQFTQFFYPSDKETLLLRILLELKPRNIVNFGCAVVTQLLLKYAESLNNCSKLHSVLFNLTDLTDLDLKVLDNCLVQNHDKINFYSPNETVQGQILSCFALKTKMVKGLFEAQIYE